MVPQRVLARLQQDLADNTLRTMQMITEANAIHTRFQDAGISYATLKGFTLWPDSVPRLELRSQLDLDFLVAECAASPPHPRRAGIPSPWDERQESGVQGRGDATRLAQGSL